MFRRFAVLTLLLMLRSSALLQVLSYSFYLGVQALKRYTEKNKDVEMASSTGQLGLLSCDRVITLPIQENLGVESVISEPLKSPNPGDDQVGIAKRMTGDSPGEVGICFRGEKSGLIFAACHCIPYGERQKEHR